MDHAPSNVMMNNLETLEEETRSARQIALVRITCLQNTGEGLPSLIVSALVSAVDKVMNLLLDRSVELDDAVQDVEWTAAVQICLRWLCIHRSCSRLDPVLAEELGRQGSHRPILRLIQYDATRITIETKEHNGLGGGSDLHPYNEVCCSRTERIQDDFMTLQDVAGEIAAATVTDSRCCFWSTAQHLPFTPAQLRDRLPRLICIRPWERIPDARPSDDRHGAPDADEDVVDNSPVEILLHQIYSRQSEQKDVGFVLWPAAVVLSRWLVTNRQLIQEHTRILELGAGCGLVGLVAAHLRQMGTVQKEKIEEEGQEHSNVILTDFNTKVLQNLRHNVALNDLADVCQVFGLDFYQSLSDQSLDEHERHHISHTLLNDRLPWRDMDGAPHEPVDLILGADIICQPSDAAAVAATIAELLRPGGRAILVCADAAHRFGVDRLPQACQQYGLPLRCIPFSDLFHNSTSRLDEMEDTAGYVEGMNMTFFFVNKVV